MLKDEYTFTQIISIRAQTVYFAPSLYSRSRDRFLETYLALGAAGPNVPWNSSLYLVALLTLRQLE